MSKNVIFGIFGFWGSHIRGKLGCFFRKSRFSRFLTFLDIFSKICVILTSRPGENSLVTICSWLPDFGGFRIPPVWGVDFRISGISDAQKLKSFFILLPTENLESDPPGFPDFRVNNWIVMWGVIFLACRHLRSRLASEIGPGQENLQKCHFSSYGCMLCSMGGVSCWTTGSWCSSL